MCLRRESDAGLMPLDVAVFTTMAGLCAGRSATVCTACLNSGARFRAGYQHLIADLEGSSLYGAISVDSKGGRVYQNQLVEPHVTRLAAVSTFYLDAGSDNIFRFSDQVDAPAISGLDQLQGELGVIVFGFRFVNAGS
jgi:hypothetical protein